MAHKAKEDDFKGFCGDPYMEWNCRCFVPSETGKPNEETCSELGVEGWSLHDVTDVQLNRECIFFMEK